MNEKLGGKSWLVCKLLEALGPRNKATALQETARCRLGLVLQ